MGSADRKTGEWFTFGDLISLYGDFRRIITCDARKDNSDCRLTDAPRPLTRDYEPAEFTKTRYKAMKDLAQGWNFWDANFSFKVNSIAVTNNGVIKGQNHRAAWADEFYKIAKGNHWHFGPTALKWYVAMHRQAFYLMVEAAKTKDLEQRDILIWKAMHYEGHALHSLTDLFAPGHIMVDRYVTTKKILKESGGRGAPFPRWQTDIWNTTFTSEKPDGKLSKKPLRGINMIKENDLDVLTGPVSIVVRNAYYEANFHDDFNKHGAVVRNLKRSSINKFRFVSPRNHTILPAEWRAFGDKKLYAYKDDTEDAPRLNPYQGEWATAAVEDSIRSLFDGYQAVLNGGDAAKLSMAPALFDALGDLPIEMRNVCVNNKNNCFAPDSRKGKHTNFRWVSYAPLVLELLGLKSLLDPNPELLPSCTGYSAINGPSSTKGSSIISFLRKKISRKRTEGCEKAWDAGKPPLTELRKAEKGIK